MKPLITVIALLLINTCTYSQVYRVNVSLADGTKGVGSCVCIGNYDNRGWYLTAAHVVTDDDSPVASVAVSRCNAVIEAVEKDDKRNVDVALISTPGFACDKWYRVEDGAVSADRYVVMGHRSNGPLLTRKAMATSDDRWFRSTSTVCTGDSGGPIVTGDGRVVGIVSGVEVKSRGQTCGTHIVTTVNLCRWVRQHCPGVCPPVRQSPQYMVRPVPGTGGVRYQPPLVIDPPRYEVHPIRSSPISPPRPTPTQVRQSDVDANAKGVASLQVELQQLRDQIGNQSGGLSREEVEKIASKYKTTIPNTRVLLVDQGQVIDDESYKPGEAIVLDLKRIQQAGK